MNEQTIIVKTETTLTIKPIDKYLGLGRMYAVAMTDADLIAILGEPNRKDDPDKVGMSWQFLLNGIPVQIWRYRGSPTLSIGIMGAKNVLLGVQLLKQLL